MYCHIVVMNKKKGIEDINLEKEAPLLYGIPKNNPFVVPDGYFDSLPAQIMAKNREGARHSLPIAGKIFWLFRPQWMIASFIIIVGLVLFLRKGGNSESYESIAAKLPDSVLVQSLQNNIDYVDVNALEEMAQKQNEINLSQNQADTTNKQIINYLINNNIDASDIENEL